MAGITHIAEPRAPTASAPASVHNGADLRVRRIGQGGDLGEVLQLRRDVYFLEQGQPERQSRRIADGLDAGGTTMVVEQGRRAVACLRLHDFGDVAVQIEYGDLFRLDAFARTWPLHAIAVGSRFAVRAEHRTKRVIDLLLQEAWRWGHQAGVRFYVIACEPFLHDVFEHYGFREYLPPAVLPGGRALLRMVLVMEDAARLLDDTRTGAGDDLYDPMQGRASRAWLNRTFPAID